MTGRFVILKHEQEGIHYDLMLETGDVLRTWRLPEPPTACCRLPVQRSFDHRPLYLDYEGPLSGKRGTVRRWDHGTYQGDPFGDEVVEVKLSGARLEGTLTLCCEGSGWLLSFMPGSSTSPDR